MGHKNNITNITFNSRNDQSLPLTNVDFYAFNFPPSFSLYRDKPCNIRMTSGSVCFDVDNTFPELAASVDLITDIPVQGLCLNLPFYPDGQVVQAPIDIGDGTTTYSDSGQANFRVFHVNQPSSTTFRCQALPDTIRVMISYTPQDSTRALTPVNAKSQFFKPAQLSMTLEIIFDDDCQCE